MELIIRNNSGQPIYDQISGQIKAQILSGALSPGDALPSIRGLAKDLKISVITTKRAYDELEAQGLINTVAGKGCFVAEPDLALFREQSLHLLEDHLAAAALGVDVSAPEFLNAKEDIGVVLDEGCFPETLTAPQVGRVMAATYRRWEQDTFDTYCRRFALPEKTAFKDYSRGMKMKLTIAVALSHQAQLLVLDEATAGLDPIVRDEILELFNEFTRDETHSVLISSHILSDLEKLCDYIAFLHQGRLLFCEEKDALLEQYGIFNDTAEQAEALMPEAIVSMETTPYGGVRALVRRDLAPVGFQLEKPTIEDIILALVKGEKQ